MSTAARAMRRPSPVHSAPVVWSTPALLRLGVYAVVGASVLFMIAVITGARNHRQAMQSIGKDAAPSIIAAQHIRSAMADMDADAAQELLNTGNAETLRKFEASRREAETAIVGAAQNITYGDAERVPIQNLAFGIGSYIEQVQSANDLLMAKDKRFLNAYRAAAKIMDEQLAPAAADLDKANREVLDFTYTRQRGFSSASLLFVLMSALLLCGVLLALQMFLLRRMRRLVNPLLVLATALTAMFTLFTVSSFRAEDRELKTAKEDAFDSIHALWQARALAYSANADESRYLLDPEQAAADQRSFDVKADQIAHAPTAKGGEASSGYLADEMKNITFAGEREPATNALFWFGRYRTVDRDVRNLANGGKRQEAIAEAVGSVPGGPKEDFKIFDEYVGKTLAINQHEFEEAVARGFSDVAGFEVSAPLGALLIATLAFFGLLPRIREYTV